MLELKESNWKEFLSQPEIRNVALVCLRVPYGERVISRFMVIRQLSLAEDNEVVT